MGTKVTKIETGQYNVTVNGHEWHVRRIAKREWKADGDKKSMIYPTMGKTIMQIEEWEAKHAEANKQAKEEMPVAEQESDGFVVGARVRDDEGDEGVIIATDWPYQPNNFLVMYDDWPGLTRGVNFYKDTYKDICWPLVKGNEERLCKSMYKGYLKLISAPSAQPPAPTFTRDDLKTGMVVELSTGYKYMVVRSDKDMTLVDGTQTKLVLMGLNDYKDGELIGFNEYKDGELIGFDKTANIRVFKVYAKNVGNFTGALYTGGCDIVWEYEGPPTDWAHFPMDGLVIAIGTEMPQKRHFAGLSEDGRPMAWAHGKTSFTANGERSEWADMKPYEGNEHLVGDKWEGTTWTR